MKKLMALVMVIGMASIATAGLTLDVAADNSAVTIVGAGFAAPTAMTNFLIFTDVSVTGVTIPYAGSGTGVTDLPAYIAAFQPQIAAGTITAVYQIDIKDTDLNVLDIPNGDLVAFGVTGTGWAFMASQQGVVDVEAGVQIVPEPMTLALLGLGGLFLRRRK